MDLNQTYFLPVDPLEPWKLTINEKDVVARTHTPHILILASKNNPSRKVHVATCGFHDVLPWWLAPLATIVEQKPSVHRWLPNLTERVQEIAAHGPKHRVVRRTLRRYRFALRYVARHGFPARPITRAHTVGGGTYDEYAFLVAAHTLLTRLA